MILPKCKFCKSEDLFDTDNEPGHEGEFVTVCLTCGKIQKGSKKR